MPGHVKQFPVVLVRQMCSQEPHRRQVHRSLLEPLEKDWEPPDHPGGLDAPVGGVFGEAEHLRAIREQRGAAFGEVQAPLVQLREVSD